MSTKKIKTIFIGTPDFGVPALKALLNDEEFDVVTVITQPDKKIGRKHVLTAPPIKQVALDYDIPVLQPEKIKNLELDIKNLDLIVVVAYAQIIPKNILALPKYGCINVHGSLLPYCRGASCVQQPILDGKKETGITIMLMNEGLDTGPVLSQHSVLIESNDTAGTMFEKLSKLSGEVITTIIKNYVAGKIEVVKQNDSQSSYVCMLTKADGRIDFKKSAEEIERFVRAMSPWPGAFALISPTETKKIGNKKIKILKTNNEPFKINKYRIGEIFCLKDELCLQCKESALIVEQLQLEGKKPIGAKEFLCGHADMTGTVLV